MLTKPISVQHILDKRGAEWKLEVLTDEAGMGNTFSTSELNRPGLALTGYYDVFSADRIQTLGLTEISYLRSLKPKERRQRLERIFEFYIPCVIITTSLEAPKELLEIAESLGLAVTAGSDCHGCGKTDALMGKVRGSYDMVERLSRLRQEQA